MPPTKARNLFNQGVLDYLTTLSQKEKFKNPSTHYPLIFQRAIKSIANETSSVTTFEEAKKIKNIGTFLASQIAKFYEEGRQQESKPNQPNQSKNHDTKKRSGSNKRSRNDDENDDDHTVTTTKVIPTPAQATELLKRSSVTTKKTTANASSTSSSLTPTELSLQKATQLSNYLSSASNCTTVLSENYTSFTLVLLMDTRENKSDQVQSKLLQQGIYCEQRTLPIGDMLWIARGYHKQTPTNTTTNTSNAAAIQRLPDTVEIVLDTIIERKTLDDLMSSLYGTRWNEQRLRLKQHSTNSGSSEVESQHHHRQQPQVIYLIETPSTVQQDSRKSIHTSNNTSSSTSQRHQTVQSCIFNTMIQLGFGIIRTRNLDDTITWLRRIHSRISKRYFGNDQSKPSTKKNRSLLETNAPDTTSFPLPPAVSSTYNSSNGRLLLYDEYKANIELARERGTKTVSRIFAAQLKQIQGMSVKRVNAITALYPTPKSLSNAYKECTVSKEKMVEDIQIHMFTAEDDGKPNRTKQSRLTRVGPKCSLELSHVFCLLPHGNKSNICKTTTTTTEEEETTTTTSSKTTKSAKKVTIANKNRSNSHLDDVADSSSSSSNLITQLDSPYTSSQHGTAADWPCLSSNDTTTSSQSYNSRQRPKDATHHMNNSTSAAAQAASSLSPFLLRQQAIDTLIAMGFDNKSVVRVLEQQDSYNVEVAANALLGGLDE